ncbi:MAG: ABC transporter ATP-binding protein [Bdellovibrionaceae bacterium]|nr:ABC transporter ATP-binding protein [Pseudobdellovibrionaceae bacterium]|tara:strand:- start:48240 stop:48998 length:759 start_codon:yes stop_codon:yes gene_type:complete
MSTAVEITDLRKSFDGGNTFILKGINLQIPKDKVTVIIGFSGTGKSVLIKHILGLIEPTSGSVRIFDHEIKHMSEDEVIQLRCKMGMLFQHAALFDDMTVIENVMFPLKEHRPELGKSEIRRIAEEKLIQSGMEEIHFNKLPAELSGGMRKRVGLARALSLDPEILIYDEPTTGLDPILTEMVDDLILSTHRRIEGATSIVISHDLNAAFRIGENIVMLDKGTVLMQGTPQDFLNTDNKFIRRFVDKGIRRE